MIREMERCWFACTRNIMMVFVFMRIVVEGRREGQLQNREGPIIVVHVQTAPVAGRNDNQSFGAL